ncbi:MAG: tRNA (N6-threonylcarbamoyladenosine(37)-N6)-methyltransferase TrmO [Alphaproteobacteria bacterium]|nr:tRNA (N6-threonylcarbamoyladenosine(37)-N6)-methyltransferase TrmO [Alphaproteobacteria bacterium]
MRPIGRVASTRKEAIDDDWDSIECRIDLDPAQFGPEALAGLAAFSHAEILFVFDRVAQSEVERGARHPRGRTDWPKVGIFAQRGKNRPNRIGSTIARIVGVEGLTVRLAGLDAIDGTPVLDIKPYMAGFAPRGAHREPAWAVEIMAEYWSRTRDR